MSKKMTMAEISRQLGISTMTVSRYFHGVYVSELNALKFLHRQRETLHA
jgi:LacI family sucrose operon transcriptional repressor